MRNPGAKKATEEAPRRLRLVESILQARSSRFSIVLELTHNGKNEQAILRTAEALGVQHVDIIRNPDMKDEEYSISRKITKGTDSFLTIREFQTTSDCIKALKQDGRTIWATDLSPQAVPLDLEAVGPVPNRVAIVFGRESDGCSEQILQAAARRVYIPLFGFSDSLNLSVATAMVMQKAFMICPEARGDLSAGEKKELRREWYQKLTKDGEGKMAEYEKYLETPPAPLADIRRADKYGRSLFQFSLLSDSYDRREIFVKDRVKRKMDQVLQATAGQMAENSEEAHSPTAKRAKVV